MDRHAYHILRILGHVEESPLVTNRSIAKKLNVSVKLAHELLAKLVSKGMLHVTKHHARRWDYFLTPRGLAEKARLTYEFLQFSFQFYREARSRSVALLAELKDAGVKRVAFLGTGELTEIAYLGVSETGMKIVDVFDDEAAGETFLDLKVRPASEIAQSQAQKIIVTAFDPKQPMSADYLPPSIAQDRRFVWIFADPEKARAAKPRYS